MTENKKQKPHETTHTQKKDYKLMTMYNSKR